MKYEHMFLGQITQNAHIFEALLLANVWPIVYRQQKIAILDFLFYFILFLTLINTCVTIVLL